MGWLDWLRAAGDGDGPPPSVTVPLDAVVARVTEHARALRGAIDPELVRARLADAYRDVGAPPPRPVEVDRLVAALDDEDWRRLALVTELLRWEGALPALQATVGDEVGAHLARVIEAVRACPPLTVEVIAAAPARAEEMARRIAVVLGAGLEGEPPEVSAARLARLDYGRLLALAEQAAGDADAAARWLRELQEQQPHARRGKL